MRSRLGAFIEYVLALALVGGLVLAAWRMWEPVRVVGLSMSPALRPGDLAIVRRGTRPAEGDIVLLRVARRRAVLHRVVVVEPDGSVVTKGDANPVNDRESARPHEIVGVVERVIPFGVLLGRWRGIEEVGYHDGSTEQNEAMTETTSGALQSEQRQVRRLLRGSCGRWPGGSLHELRTERPA